MKEILRMKIYIDGICKPNPGEMGIGVYFEDGTEISEAAGKGTNNEAEYMALLKALQEAKARGLKDITICTDSQLLANQMGGDWQIKSETSRKYAPKIYSIMKDIKVKFEWVPREQNKKADQLSKRALIMMGQLENGTIGQ